MLKLNKMLKNVSRNHILLVSLLVLALGFGVYRYYLGKEMMPLEDKEEKKAGKAGKEGFEGARPLGQNELAAPVSGIETNISGLPDSCLTKDVVDPAQLLPRDENSEFSKLNPQGTGSLQNVNLLTAGYHVGINTVGQSLRNANLQVRSEPSNPKTNVGPWMNSTIEHDFNRQPLEIGCPASESGMTAVSPANREMLQNQMPASVPQGSSTMGEIPVPPPQPSRRV